MSDLKTMYDEAYHFNKMFKAKTYVDAVEEFYSKYNDILKKLNDDAEEKAAEFDEVFVKEEKPEREELREVKAIIKRTGKSEDGRDNAPERPKLTDDMDAVISEVAEKFVKESAEINMRKGKLPKGRYLMDLNIYTVMYILPGIIATDRQFAYYIAEKIGKKWPGVFGGNELGCADYDTINSGFRRRLFSFRG